MIPDLQSYIHPTRSDFGVCFDVVRQQIPQLRIIEIQWDACQLKDERLELLPKPHTLMRRMWRYPYASRS